MVNLNPSQYDIEMSHAHFFRKEKSRLNAEANRDRNKEYVQCITGASEPDNPYRNKEAEAVVQMQVKISCRRKTKDLFGFNFYYQ